MSRVRRSSTPDISLPSIPNRDWKNIKKILCVDEALNDSGAALFIDGKYVPFMHNDIDIGLSLTLSKSASQISKILAYDRWVRTMIDTHAPDLVVLESHPFIRGNLKTSIATLEVLIGVRYVTMVICGSTNVPYAEFSTNHVKTIMCGGMSATKEMVQLVLSGLGYNLPKYQDKPELINGNVCDAIAMGEVICRMQKQELLRREYVQDVGQGRPQTRNRSRG
jgi:Holliday junction resolvasome RuvABC endonuclease subunit